MMFVEAVCLRQEAHLLVAHLEQVKLSFLYNIYKGFFENIQKLAVLVTETAVRAGLGPD